MWNVALPETSSTSCSAARSSSETLGGGQRADDVEQQPRRQDDDALADDLGLERNAQADVHIGGAELAAPRRRRELDAGQRLDRAAGGGDSADRLELREQRVALERDLHDEYLRRDLAVIGRIEAVENCAFGRSERDSSCCQRTGKSVKSVGRLWLGRGLPSSSSSSLPQSLIVRRCGRRRACRRGARSRGCARRMPADRLERGVGELAGEVDRDLAGPGDPRGATGARRARRRSGRSARRRLPGSRDRSTLARRLARGIHRVEDLGRELEVDRPAGQRVVGDDADQGSLERADVVGDALGDRARGPRRRRAAIRSSIARLRRIATRVAKSGGADVGDEAGLEALAQPLLDGRRARAAGGRR